MFESRVCGSDANFRQFIPGLWSGSGESSWTMIVEHRKVRLALRKDDIFQQDLLHDYVS